MIFRARNPEPLPHVPADLDPEARLLNVMFGTYTPREITEKRTRSGSTFIQLRGDMHVDKRGLRPLSGLIIQKSLNDVSDWLKLKKPVEVLWYWEAGCATIIGPIESRPILKTFIANGDHEAIKTYLSKFKIPVRDEPKPKTITEELRALRASKRALSSPPE